MPSTPASRTPPEVWWFVPHPGIFLLGCQPFEAARRPCPDCGGRKPDCPNCGGRSPRREEPPPCSTCGGQVRDRPDLTGQERPTVVYCDRCDGMAPLAEDRLRKQYLETTHGLDATDRRDRETREADHVKESLKGVTLSEAHRRRIWMGHRKGNPFAAVEPQCLAAVGRRWLEEIGQLPDWSLVLDASGKVIGHVEPIPASQAP